MKTDRIDDSEDHITADAVADSSTTLVRKGAVLVVVRSGILRHTLPVAVAQRDVTLNQDLKALELKDGLEPDYVAWALRTAARDILHTCSKSGTTVQNLEIPRFLRYEISLPPLDEQQRIVAEVEKQFTRLDAGVASLKRAQTALKRYRASVLKAACEGRLVPTEAELARKEGRSYESADVLLHRILKQRRDEWNGKGKYKERVLPNLVDLPSLPEGWTWCLSDAVFVFVTSGSRGWAKYYSGTGAIFLRIGNLNHEDIRLDFSDVQHVTPPGGSEGTRTAVGPNDILVSITADVGMVALVPEKLGEAYINQHVALARPTSLVSAEYIAYYLSASEGGWRQLKKLQRRNEGWSRPR
jgi:type I restriction enzyme S subunit